MSLRMSLWTHKMPWHSTPSEGRWDSSHTWFAGSSCLDVQVQLLTFLLPWAMPAGLC